MTCRKAILILLYTSVCRAEITNVRVGGATATQAILAYAAPDNTACTVAVSASPSYTPLAHDVDPALFNGANSDSRPGSVNSGRLRVFVVGKRSVEKDLMGNNSSRALQAATTYYFRITCPSDGSTAKGTFGTITIPSGVGAGEPIPADPGGTGNYLYPTFSTTDRTSSAIDPHTGALVKNMTLPGDSQGGATPGMTSSGMGVMCHPAPVRASNENKYGYHCVAYINNYPALYWIAPDGETRLLGFLLSGYVGNGWNVQACTAGLSHPLDYVDPNTFYCVVATNEGRAGHTTVLKAVYSGHSVSGQDADLTNVSAYNPGSGGIPHTTYTEIMAAGRTLDVLELEFDPTWATMGACCNTYYGASWFSGKLLMDYWNNQNYPAWLFVYDPKQTAAMQQAQFGSTAGCIDNPPVTGSSHTGMAGCITASANTTWGPPGSAFRWMSLHSLDVLPDQSLVAMTNNPLGQSGAYYQVTLPKGLAASGPSCTRAQPSGNTLANWPTTSWTSGCSTFTVSGDPTLTVARAGYPSTFPAATGDMLTVQSWSGGAYIVTEVMRLLDKGSDGKTWYVQRSLAGINAYTAVAANGTLDMLSPVFLTETWWNPATGATYGDDLPLVHAAHITNSTYGSWALVAGIEAQSGGEPARLLNPSQYPILSMGLPTWNGISTAYAYEDHPSLSVSAPPDLATFNQVIDNHPYFGDTSLATSSTVTLVGGQLYRIRGVNVAANYKLIPYFANSGNRAMREVSGPSVRLAADSSAQYQWCVALNAGECYSASLAGDIYFNAPSVAIAYCNNNWSVLQSTGSVANDICVSAAFSFSQGIRMQSVKQDPLGLTFRVISNSLGKYDTDSNFWNSRSLPDGSWLFTSVASDNSLKLMKVPPQSNESVNRTSYVPLSLSLPAVSGVDNAIVEFGYGENGDPGSFYCTARRESCVAQNGTISASSPFYFATTEAAAITGMRCGSGCTITIPGTPGRVVYYQVISRDSSGRAVGRQSGAEAVP